MSLAVKIIRLDKVPLKPASHEDQKDPGVLKRVLLTKEMLPTGRLQMLNWSYLKPRRAFKPHYHQDMDEVFIILNGSVVLRVGEEQVTLHPGDAAVIPSMTTHSIYNPNKTQVEYLVFGVSKQTGGRTVVVD